MINFFIKLIRTLIKKSYRIVVINKEDKKLMRKMYEFRYDTYCLVDKLLEKKDYPDGVEMDEYDEYSIFLVAIDRQKNVLGMVRLIKNSKLGFPTTNDFKLTDYIKNLDNDEITEVSRLMVRKDYRNTFLILDLYRAIFFYSMENDISYWLGCVEVWFLKSLNQLAGKINVIGKPVFCYNALNYPFLLNLKEAKEKIKKNNKLIYFLTKIKSKKFDF